MNAKVLDRRERRVAASADLLVASNPVVADTWRSRGHDAVLVPFGTDARAYRGIDRAPLPTDVGLPGPVVGFVGRINDRTDLGLLEAIAERGRSLLLVGPKDAAFEPERFEALRAAAQRALGRAEAFCGVARLPAGDGRWHRALPG